MQFQRKPGISETQVDDGVFLVEPQSQEIFYLDAISGGLWRELAEPRSSEQLLGLLGVAFPEIAAERIAADIAAVLADLIAKRLVIEVA